VAKSWDRYRQVIRDERVAHLSQLPAQAREGLFDAEVRAAAGALMARFNALRSRMLAGDRKRCSSGAISSPGRDGLGRDLLRPQ
jgi:hypothetical protein